MDFAIWMPLKMWLAQKRKDKRAMRQREGQVHFKMILDQTDLVDFVKMIKLEEAD